MYEARIMFLKWKASEERDILNKNIFIKILSKFKIQNDDQNLWSRLNPSTPQSFTVVFSSWV